jgi:hypothetical protein
MPLSDPEKRQSYMRLSRACDACEMIAFIERGFSQTDALQFLATGASRSMQARPVCGNGYLLVDGDIRHHHLVVTTRKSYE